MKNEVTPARIAALPKWAREEIESLNRKITDLSSERDALRGVAGPGPWSYDVRGSLDPVPLDTNRVTLKLDEYRSLEFVYVRHSINFGGQGKLRVYAHGGALVMLPRATNTANLDVDSER